MPANTGEREQQKYGAYPVTDEQRGVVRPGVCHASLARVVGMRGDGAGLDGAGPGGEEEDR